MGPYLGATPLAGVLGYGVFPLVYKGFLHYTLPGDGPSGLGHWIMSRGMMHWIMHQLMVQRMMVHWIMHQLMRSSIMLQCIIYGCMQ